MRKLHNPHFGPTSSCPLHQYIIFVLVRWEKTPLSVTQMAYSTGPDEEAHSGPFATREQTPLLRKAPSQGSDEGPISTGVTTRLYISHFLSTWNSRVFEFGAVLYLATIFPGTLLPMSVYAIIRAIAAIALSPTIGHHVDTGNRLQVVRASICARIPPPL